MVDGNEAELEQINAKIQALTAESRRHLIKIQFAKHQLDANRAEMILLNQQVKELLHL
jgi:uncharacterized protein YPO0396